LERGEMNPGLGIKKPSNFIGEKKRETQAGQVEGKLSAEAVTNKAVEKFLYSRRNLVGRFVTRKASGGRSITWNSSG